MSSWDGTSEGWGAGLFDDRPWSKYVLLARERQRRDLARSLSGDPEFPYYFDDEAADRAVKFISMLRHVEGEWAGQPFQLAAWQEWDIVRPLFGWRRRVDGRRRFRFFYIELPRKNGKSTLIAAIGAYLFLADREPGAQVYSAATKEDQAKIIWDMARKMIAASPQLRNVVKEFKSSLFCESLGAVFKPLGRDSNTQDGFSPHGGLIDEYHAHKSTDMLDVLGSGRGARRQPLLGIITTAGKNTNSPCKKESDRAKRLLEGVFENEEHFAFVSTVDDPERWMEEEEWIKANPNWGISLYPEGFRSEYNEIKNAAERENNFKSKKLNIWVGQITKWLPMDHWDACSDLFDEHALRRRPCYAGLDLGITRDISALVLAFSDGTVDVSGERLPLIYLLARFWVPEDTLEERLRQDGVPYPAWAQRGLITATPGNATRFDWIRRDINALRERFDIREIAIDRAHAHQLMVELADDGLTVVKHAQTMLAMNFPCRAMEAAVLQRRLRHSGNEVLRWMASNVAVVADGNDNIKIVKDRSSDRVDGMVAAAMAIGRLLVAPIDHESVYNSRGVFVG